MYVEKEGDPFRSAIASIDGGEPTKTFPLTETSTTAVMRWTPDGHSLVYADWSKSGVGNLFAQSISGGEPKKLTDFKSELIFNFDYSRDGKQIAFSRGTNASDVLLYTNIK